MSRRIESCGASHVAWISLALAGICLSLAACSSGPNGIDVSSLPQSRFSLDDLPSSETVPSATRRTASVASAAASISSAAEAEQQITQRPAETPPALSEARQLRRSGQKAKALALLDRAAEASPADLALTRERGLLALELGSLDKARSLLKAAADAGPPDWRLHSALGSALAASGRQQEAQVEFAKALALAPDHPSVLNNLALSYALDGRHEQAEKLLRRAAQSQAAKPQARQNLALLLALKGQTDDARKLAEGVLPPEQARANASYVAGLTAAAAREPAAQPGGAPQRAADARATGEDAPVYRLGGPAQ